MHSALHTVQEQSPLLLRLIRGIMAPESQRTYHAQNEPVARIVAIIAIFCFSQRRNTCTGFQTTLGLYLHSKGVKRQQIDLLGRLGLTTSYGTIVQVIKDQSVRAAARVKEIGWSEASLTAYDNFEIMECVKEQQLDHQSTFHSVTTGQV